MVDGGRLRHCLPVKTLLGVRGILTFDSANTVTCFKALVREGYDTVIILVSLDEGKVMSVQSRKPISS